MTHNLLIHQIKIDLIEAMSGTIKEAIEQFFNDEVDKTITRRQICELFDITPSQCKGIMKFYKVPYTLDRKKKFYPKLYVRAALMDQELAQGMIG